MDHKISRRENIEAGRRVQLRKNTNQITPSIRIASPVEIARRESTDGPGSAWRASVGVSTIRWFSLVAMVTSILERRERLAARGLATLDRSRCSGCLGRLAGCSISALPHATFGMLRQLTPSGDSTDRRFKSGFPGGRVWARLSRSEYLVRSITWLPVPIGRASCGFRL